MDLLLGKISILSVESCLNQAKEMDAKVPWKGMSSIDKTQLWTTSSAAGEGARSYMSGKVIGWCKVIQNGQMKEFWYVVHHLLSLLSLLMTWT